MDKVSVENLDDSHFHILEMRKKDMCIEEIILRWKESGGKRLIDIGVDEKHFALRRSFSNKYNFIYHSVGIHPNSANENITQRLKIIEDELKDASNNKIVAIGETGLDYYWNSVDKNIQKSSFKAHIDLAIKYDKPLIIHNREASSDVLEILQSYQGKITGVIHCFSSTDLFLSEFIKLGFYISFAGNVTYKKNKDIQRCLKLVPLNRLLIETDSPYLSPTPKRGRLNSPNNIKYTFDYILKYIEEDQLKSILSKNLNNIFRL